MGLVRRDINQCDVCGYEWIPRGSGERCANKRCRSMKWNSGDSSRVERRPSSPQVDGSSPSPRSSDLDFTKSRIRVVVDDLVAEKASMPKREDIEKLREICKGHMEPYLDGTEMFGEIPAELMCPKTGYNETDGETYACSLTKGHRPPCRPGKRV